MIEKLACKLGRSDEEPNIELAIYLCEQAEKDGVDEIVRGLRDRDRAVANDCIKVLYEISCRKPELIAGYAAEFIAHLVFTVFAKLCRANKRYEQGERSATARRKGKPLHQFRQCKDVCGSTRVQESGVDTVAT
ncbi:MAG TPA: hypothetical protein VD969_00235 [Symbiobacteriaceae bacterium]|nr:hypothetical protein [Symbiobacteriaceae bacterium]